MNKKLISGRGLFISVLGISFFISGPSVMAQYVMPKGFPTPTFGITNTAGSTTITRTTAQAIASPVAAGQVITLDAGTHASNYTSPNTITCTGTSGSPAYIRGSGTLATTISGEVEIVGTYCIVENIKFTSHNVAFISTSSGTPTNHIWFRDCEFAGDSLLNGGITVAAYGSGLITDVGLLRNNIHNSGDVDIAADQDNHGIAVGAEDSATLNNIFILSNSMSLNSGDGIQINCGFTGTETENCHHIYVGKNTSFHNKQTGMWVKGATDVIFSENEVYENGFGLNSMACEGNMGYQYDPKRVWFIFNNSHDGCLGLRSASDYAGARQDLFILGNVFTNNTSAGISPDGPQSGLVVAHNTVTGSTKSFWNEYGGTAGGTWPIISSNVFTGTTTFDGPDWSGVVQRNNVSSQGASVDAGVSEAPYATYLSLYGVSIQVDYNGVSRPQGGVWDAGATEPSAGPLVLTKKYGWRLYVK